MNRMVRDGVFFAGMGALVGVLPALLAASAWAVFRTGGDLTGIDPFTIRYFAPTTRELVAAGGFGEPFRTAALIGLAVFATFTIGAVALGVRPRLTSHGDARWATKAELERSGLTPRLKELRAPIVAKTGSPKSRAGFIAPDDAPHSLIVAPTGAGKGVGVVIPTLLTYPGSVICLDLKGENFEATARRRRAMKDRVFRFAPYDRDRRTHRFNPLDEVAAEPPARRFTEASRVASSLIIAPSPGAAGFLVGARELFTAGAMLAIEEGEATIGRVYDLLSAPGRLADTLQDYSERAKAPEARTIFARMAGTEAKILSSFMSVLSDGGLSLWADRSVRAATGATDFSFTEMRRGPTSLFITVSPNDLVPLAPLIRLLVQQAVAALQRARPKEDEIYPVLFLLDEFASLGRMDALSQAITTLRGYGGRMMIVVQSLANLRDGYGRDGASNFIANCGLQLFMAPADEDTPEYISRAIGDFTRISRSKSWTMGEIGRSNTQERAEGARLIRPEALRRLAGDEVVILYRNGNPIRAKKVRYFEDRVLRKIFEGQGGALPQPEPLAHENSVREAAGPPAASEEGRGAEEQTSPQLVMDDRRPEDAKPDLEAVRAGAQGLLARARDAKKACGAVASVNVADLDTAQVELDAVEAKLAGDKA